jgi:hypothetical protein
MAAEDRDHDIDAQLVQLNIDTQRILLAVKRRQDRQAGLLGQHGTKLIQLQKAIKRIVRIIKDNEELTRDWT